ncbi:hypothetical protein G3I60_35830 [Streptomyces sp. SID13666]|uniref:hypothetical protein n=1 Tax=unclassified Streptomyces TaxID=2593676 RepID=UPI0013C10A85|nr:MULTISPECIES: hypothetical protein [unclassified Streptomyces]MCZ4103073.1 hypothetical protein [Streptomyces sp. H39-C1]NEA59389.1 hypothetical protein [Streptomyces sp. SID13666]
MANLADEYGTDVEVYIKALTTTIHADTATGAPGRLLDLLDPLGLERREVRTAGPVYTRHVAPQHLDADEQKRLAIRAIPALLLAGYKVNCAPEVFNEDAYQQAVREIRASKPAPAARHLAPVASPKRPAPSPRTP